MKKLKKIFLHVGSDKTGSTAIQYALHHNRETLGDHSYLYAQELYHPLLAAYFSEQPLELDYFRVRTTNFDLNKVKLEAKQFVKELSKRIETGKEEFLILSYEGFTGLTETEFKELKAYLNRYSDDIEVIYYLRPPLSYAPSAVSQRIKFGTPSWKIHPPVTYFRPRLSVLASVFGKRNLNLRNFSRKALVNSDVVADFLSQIGLKPDLIKVEAKNKNQESNSSLSEEAILIGDEIIKLLGENAPKGADFNQQFLPILEKIEGGKFSLNDLQQEVIKRATASDVAFIRSEFGLDISDDKKPEASGIKKIPRKTACSIAKLIIESQLPGIQLGDGDKADEYTSENVIREAYGKITCDDSLPLTMQAGKKHEVRVIVHNRSNMFWGGVIAPVKASYHWLNNKKNELEFEGERTLLPDSGVAPGSDLRMKINITAPQQPGDYFVELTLLQEYFNWFEKIGFDSAMVPVRVVE